MPFQEQYRDYFTTAVNRQESFLLCPSCASQGELFIPVWSHKHDSHDGLCLPWPDCTLSSPDWLHLMNRQVTQSIATQWRCCCHWTDGLVLVGFCFPSLECWPFSPILPIQEKHSRNHTFLRCGLSATYHCMPLFSEEMNGKTFEQNHSSQDVKYERVRHTAD